MENSALRSRRLATQHAFLRMVAGERALVRDGVTAAVVPATPERSVFNSVAYDEPEALLAALEELGAAERARPVEMWERRR